MTDHLVLAHSEIRSLVAKAARGAGLPWGLSEEAGWAADWLSRRSLPAADWAALWLADAVAGQQTAIDFGTALADRTASGARPTEPGQIPDGLRAPGFLLPFLHRVALRHGAVELAANQVCAALVAPDGTVAFGPAWAPVTAGWSTALAAKGQVPSRRTVAASVVDCLEGLALRTTVPPSAQSRQDAGASTPDDD